MKRILITGARSYIGESFEKYANEHYSDELEIETVDMLDEQWRNKDFSGYDVIFHVAGIAHVEVKKLTDAQKDEYYRVNTDLAIETARKAKIEGVKQFVFMSSIIIYGDAAPYGKIKRITPKTKPQPTTVYGDSKWKADQGIRALADSNYQVCVLRPPMIYGKGCKGNYPSLVRLAKKLPFFPNVNNERSMLYIENLCEFLCQVMICGGDGVFWPQNSDYVRTSEMVKLIGDANGRKIVISKVLNLGVAIASKMPGKIGRLTNKAFGSLSYEKSMSRYEFEYQKHGLQKSIERTES